MKIAPDGILAGFLYLLAFLVVTGTLGVALWAALEFN